MQNAGEHKAKADKRRPKPKPENLHLDSGSAGYFGVLAKFRDVRVAVHSSRSVYLVQHRGEDGRWKTYRTCEVASLLRIPLIYDIELAEACKALPEAPTDAVKAVRAGALPMTAAQMAAAARRARAALRKAVGR